jgi:hypothetical protein
MNETLYFCVHCKQECDIKWEDEGIGGYEYWGATGVDKKIVGSSQCCDSFITTDYPEEEESDN